MKKKKRIKKVPLQFSKRMSVTVMVFWIIFRLAEVIAAVWQPTIADALVKLVAGVDSVMMVNLGFYCGNSVAEKAILAWMDSKQAQGDEGSATVEYAIKNETTLEQAEEITQIEEENGGEDDGDYCG